MVSRQLGPHSILNKQTIDNMISDVPNTLRSGSQQNTKTGGKVWYRNTEHRTLTLNSMGARIGNFDNPFLKAYMESFILTTWLNTLEIQNHKVPLRHMYTPV